MFNGTILVSEKGSVIYRNSFGYANPVTKEPLNNKSVFYLASLSKQFTAMAIMMLREKNKLSYNDKLSKYFPEFPAYANEVTIRHLLTHTSGIPDHYRLGIIKTDLKNSDVLAALIKQNKLDFKPGEKFSYSNGGYVLLALIVEKVSGVSLSTYLQNNIFKPLKMSGTLVYDESKPAIMNRVVGSNMFDDIDDYQLLTTGAGGMFSTIDDMSIWDRALYTEKLVSQKTLGEAYALTVLNDGTLSNYGFGWVINELGPNKLVAHSGSMAGFRTQISRDLTNRTAYIILTNKGNTVPMNEIARGIEGILNDTEYALPKAKISSKLYGYLKTKSVEEAINRTRSLVKDQPDQYQIDEQAINALGYHYLQEKK
jgi:CubicO group peptidase (beta-lactamase class C family)